MKKEILKEVIYQRLDRGMPKVISRDLEIPLNSGKVVNLIGARRTGKTFLMFQLMEKLKQSGVGPEQILYLNFEDDRLYPVETPELDLILKAHRELFPDAAEKCTYIFLDEVQNVKDWERYVRRIYDTENVSVFLTGSSSSLLQRDMSTAMRGRSITFEVFPLSFSEFLAFNNIDYVPYSSDSEARVVNAFHNYLNWGGFPEVVLADEALKPLILQEYASLMLHRDLLDRNSVRNERLMHLLLKFCAMHTGSLISVNKLYRDFTSQGLKIGKATLYDYLNMIEDAFIVFTASKYDPSSRRQLQAPQKIHLLDPGLLNAYCISPEANMGHRFESLVFLHERRKRRELNYYRNGFELDICWNDGEVFVNAVWNMSDMDTKEREQRALNKGRKLWPQVESRLVYGIADNIPAEIKDYAIPAWKYFMNSELWAP